jgi:hypothetical protein
MFATFQNPDPKILQNGGHNYFEEKNSQGKPF